MERGKWETAIRCLEVALHPNTSDDEVLAGVNGFRRTAKGTPLSAICDELTGNLAETPASQPAPAPNPTPADAQADTQAEAETAEMLERLRDAERRVHELSAEIRTAEQDFADFRAASAQIVDGLKDQNFDLRGALETARQRIVERPARPAPFRDLLAAARERGGDPLHGPATGEPSPGFTFSPRHPWTA